MTPSSILPTLASSAAHLLVVIPPTIHVLSCMICPAVKERWVSSGRTGKGAHGQGKNGWLARQWVARVLSAWGSVVGGGVMGKNTAVGLGSPSAFAQSFTVVLFALL